MNNTKSKIFIFFIFSKYYYIVDSEIQIIVLLKVNLHLQSKFNDFYLRLNTNLKIKTKK